jgi:hypothetical protein
VKYVFVRAHRAEFGVRAMCRVLRVHFASRTFGNPKRKHTNNGMLSPVDFEIRQQKLNEAGV